MSTNETIIEQLSKHNLGDLNILLPWIFATNKVSSLKDDSCHQGLPLNLTGMVQIVDEFDIPIGRGTSSTVMEGLLTFGEKNLRVAIKRRYFGGKHSSKKQLKAVAEKTAREVKILRQINHPNIVKLLGIAVDEPMDSHSKLLIVSSICEGQQIKLYLRRNPKAPRMPLTLGIASGLKFLHEHRVVHGQIKPRNIAVKAGEAVLTDFSYARIIGDDTFLQWGSSMFRYTPHELIRTKGNELPIISPSSDVYAFAFVALFVLSGVRAFPTEGHSVILNKLIRGERPAMKDHAFLEMNVNVWKLLEECWSQSVSARPSMTSVMSRFRD